MKRRVFIKFTAITSVLFASQISFANNISKESLSVLDEVYEILFPKTNTMPSSRQFGALKFLLFNLNHKSFDDYDKNLILQGAKDFHNSFPEFLNLPLNVKETILKEIANTNDYAQSWLSKLIYYGFEAMLGDPIYKGNPNEIAWKSIKHFSPYPKTKRPFGEKL